MRGNGSREKMSQTRRPLDLIRCAGTVVNILAPCMYIRNINTKSLPTMHQLQQANLRKCTQISAQSNLLPSDLVLDHNQTGSDILSEPHKFQCKENFPYSNSFGLKSVGKENAHPPDLCNYNAGKTNRQVGHVPRLAICRNRNNFLQWHT